MNPFKSLLAWIAAPFKIEIPQMNITAPATALLVGATMQLTASESSGFTSSDSSVATVDSAGLVAGVAAGSVTITAISLSDATQTAALGLTVTAMVAVGSADVDDPKKGEPAVNTEVLKKLLSFMGHDVEHCWDEMIALAKKVL